MQKALFVLLIAASLIATAAVWGRFIWAVDQPTAARFIDIRTGDSPADEYLFCFDPSYQQGDVLWRNCSYTRYESEYQEVNVMVRYDTPTATAAVHAEFPEVYDLANITALAPHENGDFALVKSNDKSWLYRMSATGGAEPLFTTGGNELPYGLVWQGDVIELVHGQPHSTEAVVTTVQPDGETSSREVNLLTCEESEVCRLEMAYYADETWHFIYSRVPADVSAEEVVAADLLEGTEADSPVEIGSLPLDFEGHYTLEDGRFAWLRYRTYLDGLRGNLVINYYGWQPFEWNGESWLPMELPPETPAEYDVISHYRLAGENPLEWQPKVEGLSYEPSFFRLSGSWVELKDDIDFLYIYAAGQKADEPVDVDNHRGIFSDYNVLMRAENGGYWYLGTNRTYVQLDSQFRRADGLSFSERLDQLMGNYDSYSEWQRFYREDGTLKKLSFFVLLFYIPVLYGLVGVYSRFHKELSWLTILGYISGGYLILLLIFRSWFWEMTALL